MTQPYVSPERQDKMTAARALAARRLGISLTESCPLGCRHCSVDAGTRKNPAHEKTHEIATCVMEELPQLRNVGLRYLDFTGGEPTLHPDLIAGLSGRAYNYGIRSTIITSAFWADAPLHTHEMIDALPCVDEWDISTDVYHVEFVDLSAIQRAYAALKDAGKTVRIRIAHHEPLHVDDARLINEVYAFAGKDIGFQPIGPVGRAASLEGITIPSRRCSAVDPCPTTGPFVRPDGSVKPCCGPVSHRRTAQGLFSAHVLRDGVTASIERWRVQPLLQMIRLWGFAPLCDQLAQTCDDLQDLYSDRVCDQCVRMVEKPVIMCMAHDIANDVLQLSRTASGLQEYFGEPWMNDVVKQRASAMLEEMNAR